MDGDKVQVTHTMWRVVLRKKIKTKIKILLTRISLWMQKFDMASNENRHILKTNWYYLKYKFIYIRFQSTTAFKIIHWKITLRNVMIVYDKNLNLNLRYITIMYCHYFAMYYIKWLQFPWIVWICYYDYFTQIFKCILRNLLLVLVKINNNQLRIYILYQLK